MDLRNAALVLLSILLLAWTSPLHAKSSTDTRALSHSAVSASTPPVLGAVSTADGAGHEASGLPLRNLHPFPERPSPRSIQVTLPDTTVQNTSVTIPIRATGFSGANITSYQFTLTYDASVITITDVDAENTLSSSGSVTPNPGEGELKVAYASTEALGDGGVLLNLNVELVGTGQSSLTFTELRFFDADAQEVQSSSESGQIAADVDTDAPESPNNLDLTPQGADVELSWSLSASEDVSHQLIYRGTTAQFDTTGMLIQTVDSTTTSFTDSSLQPGTTYYYRIAAVDGAGNTSALSGSVSAISVNVTRSFADASSAQNYKLVALPGDANTPLQATLSGDAGSTWQAWWDNGSDSDFLIKFDGSDQFTFTSGRGFWLISTNDWSVQAAVDATSLLGSTSITIPLHDGWNIISNPLSADVAWSAIGAANSGTLQTLWQWDGSFTEAATFQSATSGEAYYFLNDQNLGELTIPLPTTSSSASTASKTRAGSALLLEALQNGQTTSSVRAGIRPEAEIGLDRHDQFAPPSRFETASLHLSAPESSSSRLRYLAHEWRPQVGDGQTFDLVLRSSAGARVQLQASELGAFAGREVALIDESTGQSYDLHTSSTVTLHPQSDQTKLRLVIGSSSFVEKEAERVAPDRLQLLPNYPNPFSGQTTVAYALPERADVHLAIYDIVGRRVQVLKDGEQRAGVHNLQWNGQNSAGQPVASGLYIVRFEAMGQRKIQKITLVR